ncbi:CNNM2 [Cordylochernes scorpioides]|uniref:CNNM2 n=1 Tax=Cordylochernes scorpioides TaxID=51811 RepID=A0ABY6KHZ9_9ARAC|nr:CNNM2 [Cordylochernes scorpioides]
MDDGSVRIPANQNVTLRIFGNYLTANTSIAVTSTRRRRYESCEQVPVLGYFPVDTSQYHSENTSSLKVYLPLSRSKNDFFYFCVRKPQVEPGLPEWVHQGHEPWIRIHSEGRIMPLWIQIILILFLLVLSGLFSGLNLGLMSLGTTELQVISNCGSSKEKNYAKSILPLRKRGNYLLCSLLLGNVLVNSTLTILLDDLTSGLVAIVGSTMSIVIIGEIIPQAICSRHGLAVGAKTLLVTKIFMLLTLPLSYPISKILDFVLGEEIGNIYDRDRLTEYIRLTRNYNRLENEEVNMITGALELKSKQVHDVMTRIEDVYMIPIEATINFDLMSEIVRQGYTRIPVYENNDRNSIIALLHTKDLAFVDPDDNMPLKVLCNFYNHPIQYVFEDEPLDKTLNEFKKGRSHLALVHKVTNVEGKDPFYEITGVVSLEDIIEEILQFEIIDETDVVTDNRKKQRREPYMRQDFSDFAKIGGGQKEAAVISPQMALATYQFLSTSFKSFKMPFMSENVLRRLLRQNIYHQVKSTDTQRCELYRAGKPDDSFILILEGRVKVHIGKESLEYDTGPFAYFGLPAIYCQRSGDGGKFSFTPDYTVVAITDVSFLKIPRSIYVAAVRATLLECQQHWDSMKLLLGSLHCTNCA